MKLKVYTTKKYFELQKEDKVRNKIGWLNTTEELKETLSKLNLNWKPAIY